MNKLTIFNEDAKFIQGSDSNLEIANILKNVGVRFEQWNAAFEINDSHELADISKAYEKDIKRLIAEDGYQSYDIINLAPDNPNIKELRAKFLAEHTHTEDEVRFFIKGCGLFSLHIKDRVYSVMCEQGDLISVPAMTPHWFDMSTKPDFSAIRLFNNPDGWVANYTGNLIADKFIEN